MFRSVFGACAGIVLLSGLFICSAWSPGRMTGGGSFFVGDQRITHGFELHCSTNDGGLNPPGANNLEINWSGNHFHLENLIFSVCSTDDSLSPNPPAAGFTTLDAAGTGTYNNSETCYANWRFTDYGEPGSSDLVVRLRINCPNSGIVLDVASPTPLTFGNHQAHKT